MAKVLFSLSEQFSDARSNELAYRFVIENQGITPVELTSITPRIPENVEIIEGKDPSVVATKSRHEEICNDLTQILYSAIMPSIEEFKERYIETQKNIFIEIITEVVKGFGPLKFYYDVFKGNFVKNFEKKIKRSEFLLFKMRLLRNTSQNVFKTG